MVPAEVQRAEQAPEGGEEQPATGEAAATMAASVELCRAVPAKALARLQRELEKEKGEVVQPRQIRK